MALDKKTLFELRPDEFERLCAAMLSKEGFTDVKLVGGPNDHGVDITAKFEGRTVVVQAKHTRRLSRENVEHIFLSLHRSPYKSEELVLITSAALTTEARAWSQRAGYDLPTRVLEQGDVLRLLSEHADIEPKAVSRARSRSQHLWRSLRLGIVGCVSSILGLALSLILPGPEQGSLDTRIETVERAIGSLKDLEQYLTDMKDDMAATERATRAIEKEHAKAKELEKLTAAELEAVSSALRTRTWRQAGLNYFLAFVMGIGSSLIASFIRARWKQRRALAV